MNPIDEKRLREILSHTSHKTKVSSDPGWWVEQANAFGTPSLMKALFLREAWRGVLTPADSWLSKEVAQLEREKSDGIEGYRAEELETHPEYVSALRAISSDPERGAALEYIVRSAQIGLLSHILQLLDGGFRFEDGMAADWVLCASTEDGEAGAQFGELSDLMWSFDPVVVQL